jgi:hypothetical protein
MLHTTGAATTETAITVYAVDGTHVLSAVANGQLTIDISEWKAGMYLVKIQHPEGTQTLRLVKR